MSKDDEQSLISREEDLELPDLRRKRTKRATRYNGKNGGGSDRAQTIESVDRFPLWILLCGEFLIALDLALMITLSSPICETFHALDFPYLILVYFAAQAVLRPFIRQLHERFGMKRTILCFLVLFSLSNIVSGVSAFLKAEWIILIGKGLGGLGSAGTSGVTGVLVDEIASRKTERDDERTSRTLRNRNFCSAAIVRSSTTLTSGLGQMIGSLYGSGIDITIGWPWAMIIVSALTIVLVVLGTVIFRGRPGTPRRTRFDYPGAIIFALFLSSLMTAVSILRTAASWTERGSTAFFVAAGVLLLLLLATEHFYAKEDAVIRLDVLIQTRVVLLHWARWLCNISFYVVLLYIPVYLRLRGMSELVRGLWLTLPFFCNAAGSVVTSSLLYLDSFKGNAPAWGGLALFTIACTAVQTLPTAFLFSLDAVSPAWRAVLIYATMYFGLSAVNKTLLGLIEKNTEIVDKTSLQATNQVLLSTCMSLGTAIGGFLYRSYLHGKNISISDLTGVLSQETIEVGVNALRRIFLVSVACAGAGMASLLVWYMFHLNHAGTAYIRHLSRIDDIEGMSNFVENPTRTRYKDGKPVKYGQQPQNAAGKVRQRLRDRIRAMT